ncbi:MAG: precorrin-6A reductase [Candidatus Methanomethylophilaceae archaeon]|nr:precorrin-6A reductase [Candidatus Methanomethylophilaceae archaeon]
MTGRVLVFAGTTEGREVTEFLASAGVKVHACVATEYGRNVIRMSDNISISDRRLEHGEKCALMREYPLVIDATHPYATSVRQHIKDACAETGAEYIRLYRPAEWKGGDDIAVPDIDAAVEYLVGKEGGVLVTTGSKDIAKYSVLGKERVFARVLPNEDSLRKCIEAGLDAKNVICMQGPFSEEMNIAMLRQTGAKFMVTKDSGEPGGFGEKASAAAKAGATLVVVGRPEEEDGMTFEEVISLLKSRFGIKGAVKRVISIVGIGMGTRDGMTLEAVRAVEGADLVVGARRMVASVGRSSCDILEEYASDKILKHLDANPQYRKIAVLVSGDIGFFSAAKKLVTAIDAEAYEVRTFCGISSMVHLCGRMGVPWDDVRPISAHGREANVPGEVRRNGKVFALLHGSDGAKRMCAELREFGLEGVKVTIGQDLGNPDEKIISGTPSEVSAKVDSELCAALIENPSHSPENPIYIPDEEFIRGDAPMTKSEVRALSVAKLKLRNDSIVYDIGAGTGSVAVEMARVAVGGRVYAIEKEPDAVALIEINRKKFCVPNLEAIRGTAPAAMGTLPAPTHAFIGGSSGNLKKILEALLAKNPSVRIVVNTVTLETLSEVIDCIRELNLTEEDITGVSISKGRKVGGYHLMTAQNPVNIIVLRGPSA